MNFTSLSLLLCPGGERCVTVSLRHKDKHGSTGASSRKEMARLKFSLYLLSLCACTLAHVAATPVTDVGKIVQPITEAFGVCTATSGVNTNNVEEVLCTVLPEVNECLMEEERKWNETHSGALGKVFVIYRDLWNSTMERLCDNGGEKLSNLDTAYNSLRKIISKEKLAFMMECFFYGSMPTQMVDDSQADTPSKVWYIYHQVQIYSECFHKHLHTDQDIIKELNDLAEETLKIMKCIRPQDLEIVLCNEVDTTLIDREHMCPVQEVKYSVSHVSEFLVKKSINCFNDYAVGPRPRPRPETESLEQFQKYYQRYCDVTRDWFMHCQMATSIAADLCLPEKYVEKYKLVRFYMELLRETGCTDDGSGLATLFHRFQVVNNSTAEQATTNMTDCLHENLVGDSESLDVNGYYNELPAIRQCLLDMMSGDTAFETVLDGMYKTIRDGMKCLDIENGKVVFCKDIF